MIQQPAAYPAYVEDGVVLKVRQPSTPYEMDDNGP